MSTPMTPTATLTGGADWRMGEHAAHFDPLLDSVVAVAQIFGIATTPQALSAGLPLVENLLTPALLPRAAARAGLTVRIARRTLDKLRPSLLPVILLLKEKQACILLEWMEDGRARVRYPENGESADTLSREELDAQYAGIVFFVRPVFNFDPRSPDSGKSSRNTGSGVLCFKIGASTGTPC